MTNHTDSLGQGAPLTKIGGYLRAKFVLTRRCAKKLLCILSAAA
jgi:hypothetical protein